MLNKNRDVSKKILYGWLLFLTLGIVLTWLTSHWVGVSTALELRQVAKERLSLYQGTLTGALEKYRYLPFVLSGNEDIKQLLTTSRSDPYFSNTVSRSLSATNNKAESNVLYVMDNKGNTLASSNWKDINSFVGHNYSFRPYFLDAMQGKEGRFFAIGIASGIPGFYMSHPVYEKEGIVGVVIVKVNLAPLQRQWRDGGETVFISDENSVIFLSSRDDWLYKTLNPITSERMKQIKSVRQYGNSSLEQLTYKSAKFAGEKIIEINKRKYLETTWIITNQRWNLHYLFPVDLIKERQRTTIAIGSVLLITIFVAALFIRERRQKQISSRRALESEKIQAINQQLEVEIVERRRTEKELRSAQDGLVQAGKLAALGQMSAAIAHEINQPIAAMRTFVASARLLLQKGKIEELDISLQNVTSLTERMGAITGQLKTFARKAPSKLEHVEIMQAISRAIALVQPLLDSGNVVLTIMPPKHLLFVEGDEVRLEQVFINLLRNAIDAMEHIDKKRLEIFVEEKDSNVVIRVRDNGTGLNDTVINQLYDPFFTTKINNEGLGLGLSITYGIVKDLTGHIEATNNAVGGAEFLITFPSSNKPTD
ncbi:ATP-binding protein [Kiloniella antarctica]|uniref:histidine kinase n=1 Tax=Kiloniella antarctica TaxID=1550907 RepID=A0ABW5BR83_9PROT